MPPTRPVSRSRVKAKASDSNPYRYLQVPRNAPQPPARPPLRKHSASYHRPLLLDDPSSLQRLLSWFEHEEESRNMPWRQSWIDPDAPAAKHARTVDGEVLGVQEQLKRRAYQVWISEIMLQQTRVETVRAYWKSWMERWPTMEALAAASRDDVLAAWRGLGYYSRATRIHEGAQLIVQDDTMKGLMPEDVGQLQKIVPGVGRYTAGAISSIVFGRAVPILDGNIARVLSRQSALYMDAKAKQTADLQWEMARLLVEQATVLTHPGRTPDRSATPGKWNQALMELGSTLCTPTKPDCANCPIQSTCLAYSEGVALSAPAPAHIADMEDLCTLCEDLPEMEMPVQTEALEAAAEAKGMQQTTLFGKAPVPAKAKKPTKEKKQPIPTASHASTYASQFPKKVVKQKVRVESRLVCIVRLHNASSSDTPSEPRYLVQQRPDKGLLASLWEFPTEVLPNSAGTPSPSDVVDRARAFVPTLHVPGWEDRTRHPPGTITPRDAPTYLGQVKHVFSHLEWDMHVCLVEVDVRDSGDVEPGKEGTVPGTEWLSAQGVDAATMGTGLRRCWSLVP